MDLLRDEKFSVYSCIEICYSKLLSVWGIHLYFVYGGGETARQTMTENNNYFIVKKKALPEVLLKVVEAKRLLETDKSMTVQSAMNRVGISRSSYYKYKDDIMPFRENLQGKTITFMIIMEDIPGLLSAVLRVVAGYQASILTILQAIPINGIASLTISVDVLSSDTDIPGMVADIENLEGICELKLLSRE